MLDQQFEKYFRETAEREFMNSKWEWKWEVGERSGYPFWKFFDPEDSSGPIYKPLPSSRHIRVLQVECTADEGKKQFLGNLVPVCIDDPEIPYIAISYTWGDPAVFADIDFKYNRRLGITKSVYTVLDNMLQKGNRLRLWIDLVCINQENIDERNMQVGNMADVYRKAMHVVICLGESNLETEKAMDTIYPLHKAVRIAYDSLQSIGTVAYRRSKHTTPGMEMWARFEVLLSKPWFERIWVVQEVATGWKAPLLICGRRAVDWDSFCSAIDGYMVHHSSFRDKLFELDHSSSHVGLLNILIMSAVRRSVQGGHKVHLQTLLLYLSHFKATDCRDKVFALLGLSQDADDQLQPDYNTNAQQVFQKAAQYLLLHNSFIYLLSKAGVGFLTGPSSLPSWVPDFEQSDVNLYGAYYHQSVHFQAAGDSKPIVSAGTSDKSIIVEGIRIDTISKLTDPCLQASLKWLYQVDELVEEAHNMSEAQLNQILRSTPSGNENWLNAVWLALVNYNIPSDSINDRASLGRPFQLWKEHIFESKLYHDFESASMALAEARHAEGRYRLPTQLSPELQSFDRICKLASNGRRFFITKSGLMGVTSPGTKIGDEIVLFLGASTPFVIRRNNSDSFTLVGTSYVHGIMHGEAMRPNETSKFLLV